LLDEELQKAMENELPENVPTVFISSLTNKGISDLKDLIWKSLK
jgi:GTPase